MLGFIWVLLLVQQAAAGRKLGHEGSLNYVGRRAQRHGVQNKRSELEALRIKRAQVDPHGSKPVKLRPRGGPSVTTTSPLPGPTCKPGGGSDSCTDPYYGISNCGVQLTGSETFPANGHVNFQYIPLSQYQGTGTYLSRPSNWTPQSAGMHFDPNNNQPGTPYIGKSFFPFSAVGNLPSEGYCIIWVQVAEFNQHYGEGGQSPVCCSSSGPTTITGSSTTLTSTSLSTSTSTSTSSTNPPPPPQPTTVPLWGQCGGWGWTGPTTCVAGAQCVYANAYYSQCLPASTPSPPQPTAQPLWAQCGGQNWTGATTCVSGAFCQYSNPYYSQCVPSVKRR